MIRSTVTYQVMTDKSIVASLRNKAIHEVMTDKSIVASLRNKLRTYLVTIDQTDGN